MYVYLNETIIIAVMLVNDLYVDFQCMQGVNSWGLDVFKVSEATGGRPLTAVTYTILKVSERFTDAVSKLFNRDWLVTKLLPIFIFQHKEDFFSVSCFKLYYW